MKLSKKWLVIAGIVVLSLGSMGVGAYASQTREWRTYMTNAVRTVQKLTGMYQSQKADATKAKADLVTAQTKVSDLTKQLEIATAQTKTDATTITDLKSQLTKAQADLAQAQKDLTTAQNNSSTNANAVENEANTDAKTMDSAITETTKVIKSDMDGNTNANWNWSFPTSN